MCRLLHQLRAGREVPIGVAHEGVTEIGGKDRELLLDVLAVAIPVEQRPDREAMPEVVWVGLSTPKQERWMAAHVGRLDASVLIGVGAAFDIHAGTLRQAPRWMQRSGLEWLFRLAMEPRRLWRRYVVNIPRFLFAIVRRPPHLRTELADAVIVRPGEGLRTAESRSVR